MTAVAAALLSILSVLIGLLVGHFLTEWRARRVKLFRLRLEAYVDFVNAVSRLAAARRTGVTSSDLDDLAALNNSKARICICGDVHVVEALVDFWEAGGTLERELEIVTFSRLCMRMRESMGLLHREVAPLGISDALFRLEPSEYSYKVENPEKYQEAKLRREAAQ